MNTSVTKKSVQYVAQFLVEEDLYCACARFCYSVSPWVTFQKFWNNKWIKICVYCYSNIFILGRRISLRKQKFRQLLSSMCALWFSFVNISDLSPWTLYLLTRPRQHLHILTTTANHRRLTGLCSWRVWYGGIKFIETNHHFCMKKYFYNAFIHYEFLIKSTHPFLLSTMENVGSSTCLWL